MEGKSNKARNLSCLLLVAGVLLAGCGDKVKPGVAQVERQAVSGVSVANIAPAPVDEFYETGGTIKAVNISYVASRMMGTVTAIFVREGDIVRPGQLLLAIDDRDVAQKVKAAEAGYQEALKALESAGQNKALSEITHGRYRKMYDEKAISQQEMDQVETQNKVAALEYERIQEMVGRAAAGLSEAKVYLDFTKVTAPSTGMITEKKIEVGSMAAPGMPLFTLENTEAFNAEITVDESLSGKFKPGAPVVLFIDAINRQTTGKIREILPAIDPLSRSFTVKIALSGAGLRSGLYVKARIKRGGKQAILAPLTAVVEKGQLTGVYTVDAQNIITYRLIKTGKRYGDNMEILSGLSSGDRVIVKGVEKAVDGGVMEKQGTAGMK